MDGTLLPQVFRPNHEQMPSSRETERAVLACVFAAPELAERVAGELDAEDFFHRDHRVIYESVLAVLEAGRPIDLINVTDELSSKKKMEEAGGVAYLAEMTDGPQVVHHLPHYLEILKEKSNRRKLIKTFADLGNFCYANEGTASDVLDIAASRLHDIRIGQGEREFVSIGEVLVAHMQMLKDNAGSTASQKTDSGFAGLDELLGGMRNGALLILAARPGMGKSALALNIAQKVALRRKIPVAVFSLEMSNAEVMARVVASELHVNAQKISSGNLDQSEWVRLTEETASVVAGQLFIDDSSLINPQQMLSRCRQLKLMYPELGLVVVDYLQLVASARQRSDNRQQEISDISRQLKIMARELDLPVLALSQLSRACEMRKNKRPLLSDLRDSGAIEQDADVVMFLYRKDYYQDDEDDGPAPSSASDELEGASELNVAKNRHGKSDMIKLVWDPRYTLFTELAPEFRNEGQPAAFHDNEFA